MHVDKNLDLVKCTDNNAFISVQELVKDFDSAVITHAINEKNGNPESLQMCKMVVLYNAKEISFEDVVLGATNIMKNQLFSLVKSSVFNIIGNRLKKTSINYKAFLFKHILGFTPNSETVSDETDSFNKEV